MTTLLDRVRVYANRSLQSHPDVPDNVFGNAHRQRRRG
jgi:hypothetical protein